MGRVTLARALPLLIVTASAPVLFAQAQASQVPDLSTPALRQRAFLDAVAALQAAIADAKAGRVILTRGPGNLSFLPIDRRSLDSYVATQVPPAPPSSAAAEDLKRRLLQEHPAVLQEAEAYLARLRQASSQLLAQGGPQPPAGAQAGAGCGPPRVGPLTDGDAAGLMLRSGECIRGILIDMGGVDFTITVAGSERRIPIGDVAMIDFTDGGSAEVIPPEGQHLFVMRSGQRVGGRLVDVRARHPLTVDANVSGAQRSFSSTEVDRIVLQPVGAAPVTSGGCGNLAGVWSHEIVGMGPSTFNVTRRPDGSYGITENGLGNSTGTLTLAGSTARYDFTWSGGAGVVMWTMNSDCSSGDGAFVTDPSRPRSAIWRGGALPPTRNPAVVAGRTCQDLSGVWSHEIIGMGPSTFNVTRRPNGSYGITETGLGNSTGTLTLTGSTARYDFTWSGGAGVVMWTMNSDCSAGDGTFVTDPSRPRSTIRRSRAPISLHLSDR